MVQNRGKEFSWARRRKGRKRFLLEVITKWGKFDRGAHARLAQVGIGMGFLGKCGSVLWRGLQSRGNQPCRYPNLRPGDGGAIGPAQPPPSQQLGGVHRALEESPEIRHQRHKCLYPAPHLWVAVSIVHDDRDTQVAKSTLTLRPPGLCGFWRRQLHPLLGRGVHHE